MEALLPPKFRPTDEQATAAAAFAAGNDLKIIAGAGTGKTSTLSLLSRSTARKGVYLAFNRAMADDAKKRMPANVKVYTGHGLAYAASKGAFASKINARLPASLAAAHVPQIVPVEYEDDESGLCDTVGIDLSRITVGYILLDWIRAFCNSDKQVLDVSSLPYSRIFSILDVDTDDDIAPWRWRAAKSIGEQLLEYAVQLWHKMSNPADPMPATHDVYLKVWTLKNPKIDIDFILFDEAQDANGVMLGLVAAQSAQRVYVGDPHQQIYAWRGATNAMESVKTDISTSLTESFRFGPGIARFANFALGTLCQSNLRLRGHAPQNIDHSQSNRPHSAVICRTNAGVIAELAEQQDLSRIHIAGGTSQVVGLLRGLDELRNTGKTQHSELCHFKSWRALVEHAAEQKDDLSALLRVTDGGESISSLADTLTRTAQTASRGSVVLSTAHKCKGLEWEHVWLGDDFRFPGHARWSREEANLWYVAGTRAMNSLHISTAMGDQLGCSSEYQSYTPEHAPEQQELDRAVDLHFCAI